MASRSLQLITARPRAARRLGGSIERRTLMAASKKSQKKTGARVQRTSKSARAAQKPGAKRPAPPSKGKSSPASAKRKASAGKAGSAKAGSAKAGSGKASSSKASSSKVKASSAKPSRAKARPPVRKAKAPQPQAAKKAKPAARPKAAASASVQLKKQREKALKLKTQQKQEAARAAKAREREKKLLEQEKAREKKQAEAEKARLIRERDKAKKDAQREKERVLREKDAEKERLRKEKERVLREKERERERLRKEKEREAYRRAREAERERVRTEREAARRALEGRVAQQAKEAQRISGLARGGSTRVYRPDAIPSQSGTTREGTTVRAAPRPAPARSPMRPSAPPSIPRPAPPADPETRWATIRQRILKMPERFQREYSESFDMSWIHHDSALEGVVYTFQELKTAIDANIVIVPDSSLQPVCEEIRRHKQAIEWARDLGASDTPLTAEVLKKLYLLLHPEEGDLKSVKYRKEIPQHRLYFHEYAAPDKIAVRIRQAFEWLHGPEPPKLKDPVRVAARLHFDLLRTFPFPEDSGKVARLLMNVILMRAGLPPVIIHSTERQRYYDALRGSLPTIVHMVGESMKNSLVSIEKVLDEEGQTPSA